MMAILTTEIIDMQADQRMIDETLEEFRKQINVKATDLTTGKVDVILHSRTTREVDNHTGQGFVQRHIGVTVTRNALLISQRLQHSLAEGDADVFNRVVFVDM